MAPLDLGPTVNKLGIWLTFVLYRVTNIAGGWLMCGLCGFVPCKLQEMSRKIRSAQMGT